MPRYCIKKPRMMRPDQILPRWQKLQQNDQLIEEVVLEETQKLSADPIDFCKEILGIKPFAYQEQFIQLFKENQFTAARWSRQSGKSFIVAALLLWYATTHANSAIGIVGPSWRQTKRILQRIAAFTHKLPSGLAFKPQRTQSHFTNGSTIEAFPNNPETEHRGEFFAGLDLAQTRDYSVLSVVERQNDKLFLRHLKIFQQPTVYATVLGYMKALQDRWGKFEKIRVDFTREGPSIIADMENAGIYNAEGVNFSVPRKSEMASLLKQRMASHQFFYPLLNWERPYRGEICTELNVERYSLHKDGTIGYHHPTGTHDDVFWATALAVIRHSKHGTRTIPNSHTPLRD